MELAWCVGSKAVQSTDDRFKTNASSGTLMESRHRCSRSDSYTHNPNDMWENCMLATDVEVTLRRTVGGYQGRIKKDN